MKLLFWIVGVPLLLLAAFFAVDNRTAVSISLWPFANPVQTPLFVAIIVPLYIGVVLGAVVAWFSGSGARGRARREGKRAAALDGEVAALKARLEAAERRASLAPPATPTPAGAGTSPPPAPVPPPASTLHHP